MCVFCNVFCLRLMLMMAMMVMMMLLPVLLLLLRISIVELIFNRDSPVALTMLPLTREWFSSLKCPDR